MIDNALALGLAAIAGAVINAATTVISNRFTKKSNDDSIAVSLLTVSRQEVAELKLELTKTKSDFTDRLAKMKIEYEAAIKIFKQQLEDSYRDNALLQRRLAKLEGN